MDKSCEFEINEWKDGLTEVVKHLIQIVVKYSK